MSSDFLFNLGRGNRNYTYLFCFFTLRKRLTITKNEVFS